MIATQSTQERQWQPWERPREDERGSMLIVALGILALLSILALTFVKLMTLEHAASTNYVEGVRARLIAEGGLERAMAQVTIDATAKPYSDIKENWIYAGGDYGLALEEATAIRKNSAEETQSPRSQAQLDKRRSSFTGVLGSSYDGGIDQYKIKVIDAQTQFNLNSNYEEASLNGEKYDLTYIRFLDSLGVALSKRPLSGTTTPSGRNPIKTARYPRGEPNAYRGGMAIYKFRQSRENQEFKSKTELLEVLESEDDYKMVRDYVTTKSWNDPKVVSPVQITTQKTKPWGDVVVREPRSPINVNLASKEIIAANLAGIAGRGIFLYAGDWASRSARTKVIDEGTGFDYDPSGFDLLEEHEYEAKGVVVYFDPFGYRAPAAAADEPDIDGAYRFADLIWQKVQNTPFRSFAEWEDWLDRNLRLVLANGDNGPLKWEDQSRRRYFPQHNAADLIITDLQGTAFSTQDKQKIRSDPRFEAWFYDALRDMVKSNMNPCARLSGWNPDPVVRMKVDKGGLLFMDPRLPDTDPNKPLHQYQTNEWCFAPQGVFEIIALGEVLGQIPADVNKRQDEDDDGVDDREVFAQAKVRGILQLFDTATHRTQRDFESNGGPSGQGGYGDLADRSELTTYPVPKIYWDPRAHGLSGQNLADFYRLWEHTSAPGNMKPSDRAGYLQLSTLKQEGTTDTVVVEMADVNPGQPPHFELLLQDRRIELPGQAGRENTLDPLEADVSNRVRHNGQPGNPQPWVTGRVSNRWGFPYLNSNSGTTNFGHAYGGGQFAQDGINKWQSLLLTGDGYYNAATRPSTLGYRASDSGLRYGAKENYLAGPGNDLDLGTGIKHLAGLNPTHRGASNLDVNATPPGGGSGVQPDVGGNVSATHKGGVSFWYKPDFDFAAHDSRGRYIPDPSAAGKPSQDPRFCGLLGVSHVLRNDQVRSDAAGTQGSWCRGTQMFITRTTSGDIRITRLFYEVAGPPPDLNDATQTNPPYADVEEQPWVEDPVNGGFMPITVYWDRCQRIKEYTWPPKEFIQSYEQGGLGNNPWMKIAHARIDYFVPRDRVQHWRAGEWHHFACRWDDDLGTMLVFLDDENVTNYVQKNPIGDPYQPVGGYDPTSTPPGAILPPTGWGGELVPSFVRVNAKASGDSPPSEKDANPKDMITVGSIVRDQSQKAGLFKHTRKVGEGDDTLPANGTLDDVRFFDGVGAAQNTISFDGHYEKDGGWRNELDLSAYFPPNTDKLELGSIQMIAYLPTQYGSRGTTGPNGERDLAIEPGGAGSVRLSFKVVDAAGADVHDFPARWFCEFNSLNNPSSEVGFQLTDDDGVPVVVSRSDKLIYEVEIFGARYQNGQGLRPAAGQGFPIASPVVDQVSLTYILPSPKLLLKERVTH